MMTTSPLLAIGLLILVSVLAVLANVPPDARIDCYPDRPVTADRCRSRGCLWDAHGGSGAPYCYFDSNYIGYRVVDITDNDQHFMIHLKRVRPSGFHGDLADLLVDVQLLNADVVRIKITPEGKWNSRYEVPIPVLTMPEAKQHGQENQYLIELKENNLIIRRRETKTVLFDVNLAQMVYADQYLQIAIRLPTKHLYGLGEHYSSFRKTADKWSWYTMFNRDNFPEPDRALYGSHPFYLAVEDGNKEERKAHGLFLFNSNAMDVIVQPAPIIQFRTIGGILDFFLFLGPSAESVTQQYHRLIGLPAMPPFWSLGYQQSRYGYQNFTNLLHTFERTIKASLPFDVQWTDIDMMDQNNDFTYSRKRFAELPKFIRETVQKKHGMKFIPMFDPGVSAGEKPGTYPPYDRGLELDVFVKDHTGKQPFVGKVWNPKRTVWPDFWHPNATIYWTEMMEHYWRDIPFDGAWIDMNEPSNFVDGSQDHGCPSDSAWENPPYVPGQSKYWPTLRHKTMCMTAIHHGTGLHYNLHNLFGFQEAIVTNRALKRVLKNKRPFIISRSTAPGHGHYASHWTGDIVSNWNSMKWSIAANLNFNMFGIPMVGADICGFKDNTNEELCARWYQLGAFYMFARNHNDIHSVEQDPVALGPRVTAAATKALQFRYVHLAYFYTEFRRVNRNGGTVTRPLFFEFPDDEETYRLAESQFMIGKALMVAPVLEPKVTKTKVYFPAGRWVTVPFLKVIDSHGEYLEQNSSMTDYPNIYYRSGTVVAIQEPQLNTKLQWEQDFIIVAILNDATGEASGELYWDAGDGFEALEQNIYNQYTFTAKNHNELTIEATHQKFACHHRIKRVIILGVESLPQMVTVNGTMVEHISQHDHGLEIGIKDHWLNLPLYRPDSQPIKYQFQWQF